MKSYLTLLEVYKMHNLHNYTSLDYMYTLCYSYSTGAGDLWQ